MRNYSKYIIAGAFTALAVCAVLLALSAYYAHAVENNDIYKTNVTISEKICGDRILGSNVSKIQSGTGEIFFIGFDDCKTAIVGSDLVLSYHRVCQFSLTDDSILRTSLCFNEYDSAVNMGVRNNDRT